MEAGVGELLVVSWKLEVAGFKALGARNERLGSSSEILGGPERRETGY